MNTTIDKNEHYNELITRQIDQYKDTDQIHDLPAIYDYWSGKYISENSLKVTGYNNIIEFYASNFEKALQESGSRFLISIGAGDCSIEIEVVKNLISKNVTELSFVCLELSPLLIEKARNKIDAEKIGNIINVAQIDINQWNPQYTFAGVMAHHALHHFVNLEELFELIKKNLAKKGRFLTCDKIGRNGHMRWPESLLLTRKIWERLPRKYKYNHQFKQYDDWFENRDCSTEGFEGIRAQDILPLLVKMFSFETFFAYGNLIEPFIDRGFGPNYDPANPQDTALIDYVQELDEKLISQGILKPTNVTAVMMNEGMVTDKIYKHWSPQFSVRNPLQPTIAYDVDPLLSSMPFKTGEIENSLMVQLLATYSLGSKLKFGKADKGTKYLSYGWGYPEDDFTWSTGEAAALILPVIEIMHKGLNLNFEFIPYASSLHKNTAVEVLVNNIKVKTLEYNNSNLNGVIAEQIKIPGQLIANQKIIELTFVLPHRRQPQYESGNEIRTLGIALISVKLSKL
jgi:SAM-dependent methyltransferase